jgi:molybdopterin-guanine dinucleotide biosynthesis protein A
MGRDKALLRWRTTDLLGHTLDRLREACASVAILSGPSRRYPERGVPVHPDLRKDAGALGGILAGLGTLTEGGGLFLAVDLPLVPAALLRHLLALAPGQDAVVPVTASGPEPLCAVYSWSTAAAIRARIDRGEFKMTSFWPDVRVLRVEEEDLGRYGDPERMFLNVNSPEDYDRAREG